MDFLCIENIPWRGMLHACSALITDCVTEFKSKLYFVVSYSAKLKCPPKRVVQYINLLFCGKGNFLHCKYVMHNINAVRTLQRFVEILFYYKIVQ